MCSGFKKKKFSVQLLFYFKPLKRLDEGLLIFASSRVSRTKIKHNYLSFQQNFNQQISLIKYSDSTGEFSTYVKKSGRFFFELSILSSDLSECRCMSVLLLLQEIHTQAHPERAQNKDERAAYTRSMDAHRSTCAAIEVLRRGCRQQEYCKRRRDGVSTGYKIALKAFCPGFVVQICVKMCSGQNSVQLVCSCVQHFRMTP